MAASSKNLNVTLVGRGPVTLRPSNYVTSGGEASIYRLSDIICKVYLDPDKMTTDRMTEKITLQAKYQHRFIVNPLGIIEDEKHRPIGYYMQFADGEPLSRVFTTAFRQREGFNDQDAIQLVHNMREAVLYAHNDGTRIANGEQVLLVDHNELNWLMKRNGKQPEPRLVDVDSWQIGKRWPAKVIMPSIRDFHTKGFTRDSDWFSWGIVSFQVFSGIHPYKGRHDTYKPGDLEKRMRDNVSVFHKDVHLNAAVRDFSVIPGRLLDWYQREFEKGERFEPPSPLDQTKTTQAARQTRITVSATGALVFELILDNPNRNPVIRVWPCGLALRESGALIDLTTKRYLNFVMPGTKSLSAKAEIVRTNHGYLVADQNRFFYLTPQQGMIELSLPGNCYGVVRSDNRLFSVTDQGLTELNLVEMGVILLTLGQTWPTLRLSTEWFHGVGVQDSLGAKYLVIPFGDKSVSFCRAPELDKVKVLAATAGPRFVSVIAIDTKGDYSKYEFTFDRDYTKYTLWVGGTDSPEHNLAILPNGVGATIVQDGELSIFVPQNGNVRKIADKKIDTTMTLYTWGDKVVYVRDGELWWVRVK